MATKSSGKKAGPKQKKKWSAKVNATSNALDLDHGIFKEKDPGKIALSLKRSAVKSKRKKSSPFQSAMSMLNFYINRAGKNLPQPEKATLEKAKQELRILFKKEK
ncbi:MAG: DUF3175 domain-containing protein [Bacteroidota bacterium]|nr:DUF3175 domain-containing protein [Bacteroidota bacterium]